MALAQLLPLPACGEREPLRESELVERTPPDLLHSPSQTGVNALMASGEKEKRPRPSAIATHLPGRE
jgi:hypothetical protein